MQAKSKAAGAAAQKNVASDKTLKHASGIIGILNPIIIKPLFVYSC